MARETRTVYPSKRNKGLSSTFQPPEEGRSVQRPKRCDKHGNKDEDNSQKNVNNVHDTSSQKHRLKENTLRKLSIIMVCCYKVMMFLSQLPVQSIYKTIHVFK